jgi:hypothetical protein
MCKPNSCVIRYTVHWAPYLFVMFEIIANITPLILFFRHRRGMWVLIVIGSNMFHRSLSYLSSLIVLECKTGTREETLVVPINNYLNIEMLIRGHEIIFFKILQAMRHWYFPRFVNWGNIFLCSEHVIRCNIEIKT